MGKLKIKKYSQMIRCRLISVFLVTIILLSNSCQDKESSTDLVETIKIGVLLPFTLDGGQSVMDKRLKGIILAKEEINNNGYLLNQKIELVIADNQGSYEENILKAEELVQKGCVAIIGAAWSSRTIDLAQLVTIPNNIVLISPSSSSPLITKLEDNNLVFRTIPSDVFQGKAAANYAINDLNSQSASVIFIDNAYGSELAHTFRNDYTAMGGIINSFIGYEERDNYDLFDFTEPVKSVLQNDPELIYIVSYIQEAAKIATQMRILLKPGYTPQLLGSETLSAGDFLPPNTPVDLVNGMIILKPGSDKTNPLLKEFQANYMALFNQEINDPTAANAYDALYLIAYAILNAQSSDPSIFKNHIISIANVGVSIGVNEYAKAKALIEADVDIDYNGVTGRLDMDENGDLSKATYLILKIVNNNFEEIGTIDY